MKKLILILFAIGAFVWNAQSSHVSGGYITINNLDSLKFEVVIRLYRDCNGIAFNNYRFNVRCASSNVWDSTYLYSSVIKDVTPTCDTQSKPCDPQNTANSGVGLELHILKDTLDFINDTSLSKFKNCCKIVFSAEECCRPGSINTGVSGNFYIQTTLDICKAPKNSSPRFNSYVLTEVACNQPVFYSYAGNDPNRDSLSYEFTCPLQKYNSCLSYSSPYSYTNPFQSYYPPNLPPNRRKPNRRAKPPWGITLDNISGELIFTATKCSERSPIVVLIKEWRKNDQGVSEVIGETHHEMMLITKSGVINNPPELKPDTNYFRVCEGDKICAQFETYDPPAIISQNPDVYRTDTVRLSWDEGIPDATFTTSHDSIRFQTAELCWQTKIGDGSTLPYIFTVTADDNVCPTRARTSKAYLIRVYRKPKLEINIKQIGCKTFAYHAKTPEDFSGVPQIIARTLDSTGKEIFDNKRAKFKSNNMGYVHSIDEKEYWDTLQFGNNEKIIIETTISNLPFKCETTYFDTLITGESFQSEIKLKDSIFCFGDSIDISGSVINSQDPYTFSWFLRGDTLLDSTTQIRLQVRKDVDTLILVARDSFSCQIPDTAFIYGRANPKVDLGVDERICFYDSFHLQPNFMPAKWVDFLQKPLQVKQQLSPFTNEWSYNGTKYNPNSDSQFLRLPGVYSVLSTDSMGCRAVDTFELFRNDSFGISLGADQTHCFGEEVNLELDGFNNPHPTSYAWYKDGVFYGNDSAYQMVAMDSTQFEVKVTVEQEKLGCTQSDSINIHVNPLPFIGLPKDTAVCCNTDSIHMNQIFSPTPSGGTWLYNDVLPLVGGDYFIPKNACGQTQNTTVSLAYTYTDVTTLCTDTSAFDITVYPNQEVQITAQTFVCQSMDTLRLNQFIQSPTTKDSGTLTFECVDCLGYDASDLIFNAKPNDPNAFDFYMLVDTGSLKLGNKASDTIVLNLNFTTKNGCTESGQMSIAVGQDPVIQFDALDPLCANAGVISLNDKTQIHPTGGIWTAISAAGYDDPTQVVINGKDELVLDLTQTTSTTAGKYKLKYDLSGLCPVFIETELVVDTIPKVQVTSSEAFCCNEPGVNLNTFSPNNPYQNNWSASKAGLVVNDTLFAANGCDPLQTQDFFIQVEFKDTATQCSAVDSVKLSIHPLPNVVPNPAFYSVDVCCDQPGIALDQYLPSNPFINSWSLSDTGLIVNDTFYATKGCDPLQTKVYNVKVQFTDTTTQCSATDSGVIRINPLPTVQIDRVYYTVSNDSIEDFEICTGKGDVQLEGDPTGGEWSVSPNKTGLLLDDVFQTQEADTGVLYTLVYAFEDTLGCRSTDTTFLKVACDSALSVWSPGQDPKNALKVYIPNAFTPNNTGPEANNTFTPQIQGASEYHIQIFNRLGVMVFESDTMENGWDGTYKGKPAAAGVYAYQIAVKDVRGRDQVINGVVTVIR